MIIVYIIISLFIAILLYQILSKSETYTNLNSSRSNIYEIPKPMNTTIVRSKSNISNN